MLFSMSQHTSKQAAVDARARLEVDRGLSKDDAVPNRGRSEGGSTSNSPAADRNGIQLKSTLFFGRVCD